MIDTISLIGYVCLNPILTAKYHSCTYSVMLDDCMVIYILVFQSSTLPL